MTLRWNRLITDQRAAQISWARKAVGEEFPLHDHDFPEVFWISEGEVDHEVNGHTHRLPRGQLVFIRPPDAHRFIGRGATGGVICNFAVRPDIVRDLRKRYFPTMRGAWWTEIAIPEAVTLHAAEIHALDQAARELATVAKPDLHAADRFLLNLFHLLRRREQPGAAENEPSWLVAARQAMHDPRHLAMGVPRLVTLAGCSPEHLARTVRRIHAMTPTELVNRQRIDWAASELMFSSRDIADIALAAGFESLSHFYHLFRQRHGVTPRRFRLSARALA